MLAHKWHMPHSLKMLMTDMMISTLQFTTDDFKLAGLESRGQWMEKEPRDTGQYLSVHIASQLKLRSQIEEQFREASVACRQQMFAQTVVADPCCLARQKSQTTLPTFLKYLASFKLSVLGCTSTRFLKGSWRIPQLTPICNFCYYIRKYQAAQSNHTITQKLPNCQLSVS
jgi:hypothetical protein